MDSSMMWRSSTPWSRLCSAQVLGMCETCWHKRQLTIPHSSLWHRNSLSTSFGGQMAAKSQNGQYSKFSSSASLSSVCCWMRSNNAIISSSRKRGRSRRGKSARQPLLSIHWSL